MYSFFKSQFASKALGSIRDTLLFSFNDSDGMRISPTSFIRGEIGGSARLSGSKGSSNKLAYARLRYYSILGSQYLGDFYIGKHTLASSLNVLYGNELDRDVEFLLGARNGLRGYEDRTFTGDQRLLFNLEDRFYLVEDVFRLISIGGVLFFDAGGTSTQGFGDIIDDNLYADIGFGFRFGLTRSSGGSVLRLDFAFPLRDGPDGSGAFEPRVLITSGQAFTARLPSERNASKASTVRSGFIPQ